MPNFNQYASSLNGIGTSVVDPSPAVYEFLKRKDRHNRIANEELCQNRDFIKRFLCVKMDVFNRIACVKSTID